MRMQRNICTKLQGGFLRRWWVAVIFGLLIVIAAGIIAVTFPSIINYIIHHEIALREGGRTFYWWKDPPVTPQMHVYIYNVTNAEEFLNNGKKPILDEIGPYIYLQTWEKVNVKFNSNDTVTYNVKKKFVFSENLSGRSEEDVVIVPNVPMLSATSQSKNAARFLRLAMASIMDILKIKPFVEVTVGQLLWGYEDSLLKLAKDVVPDQKLPYEQFGLFYEKNGTSKDNYTIFTGKDDITHYGLLDNWNGKNFFGHWNSSQCDTVMGSDGSIFPPQITKNTVLKIFDKDLCRVLPLVYKHEVTTAAGVPGFRFVPAIDVFSSPQRVPSQQCFCPSGPPCAPEGDPTLRDAFIGITTPDAEKHQLFIDVQPVMGTALRARARIQINLAVSQVKDIKQVATFPDIVFPLIWFEDGIDQLPDKVTSLLKIAVDLPPIAHTVITSVLASIGCIIFFSAIFCLIRAANRQEKLHLSAPISVTKPNKNLASEFQNPSQGIFF